MNNDDHRVVYNTIEPSSAEMKDFGHSYPRFFMCYEYTMKQSSVDVGKGEKELLLKLNRCDDVDDSFSFNYRATLRFDNGNTSDCQFDPELSQIVRINKNEPGIYIDRLVYPGWDDFVITIEIL